jgi:multidrug/hemolysin transport system ATP-binding protein
MEDIIVVSNLLKKYDEFVAVNRINFTVRKGQFFAFLGPNGAGKSTTINILCTLLGKDEGTVTISGLEVDQDDELIRHKIGVVFQENVLDEFLSVKENLLYRGRLYFHNDTTRLLERYRFVIEFLDLKEIENKRYKHLSGGQKRRVEIGRALISNPEILILDEPTTGLDPETRQNVWKVINRLKNEFHLTIFLTTHYMEEAATADYVIVINRGNIVAQGTPNDIKEQYSKDHLKFYPKDMALALRYLDDNKYLYVVNKKEISVELDTTLNAITIIENCKDNMQSFEVLKGTMDDAFVNIIRG